MRAYQERPEVVPDHEAVNGQARMDVLRTWLATGVHKFTVDPRRRLGGHTRARQLLADDRQDGQASSGAWAGLASALDRHTVRSGMAELSPEERQVVTLAYLEGRSNREIASILGVSVSTVRRRLWAALGQLESYIFGTGTWLSAILLLGVGYVTDRASRLTRSVQVFGAGDWAHKLTATVAVTMTVAAIGVAAISPDSVAPGRAPSTAPGLANGSSPDVGATLSPTRSIDIGPTATVRLVIANKTHSPITKHSNHGCGGNPTSAPPTVPVGRHPHGAPVTHPSKGGCRV